jgi:hypothetical protein
MPIQILHTAVAALVSVVAAAAIVTAILIWARRPGEADRQLALGVAFGLTVLVAVIYAMALILGWWGGAYFETPFVVQAGILVSVTLPGCVVWLAGYQWLSAHARQPLQIWFAISLLIVLMVAIAHRLNVGRGTILVGPDLAIIWQAVIGVALLWLPILLYEALRRGVERVTLP